ncbi:hypothetical protein [Dermatobacter hominis]|uniref:hypothetical protein n=1 Tax=Dermatobacter hominis TaxID=2884263 RepID=UPI001D11A042|nr:hypothetical protein [Dermatobacter hominis]UDY34015.1 hypothetical protein LH044_11725 [Dermatobacter hominis]
MAAASLDPRTPVLVGVGEAHRPVDGSGAVEPLELMVEASVAAAADAGAPSLLASVGMLAVPEGTWSYPDPGRLVAARIGAERARTVCADVGVPQTAPLAVALDRIRRGELDVALVVGAEAMASTTAAQRAGGSVPETAQEGAVPDERWSPQGEIMADAEVQAGMWAPVDQYACIENALGHAEGRPFDDQLDDIAGLWASFNAVATSNPLAAFPEPRTAAELRVAGPGNRPLSSPYAKWHVSQWSVDQGAALLLCSAGTAQAAGVPADRWLFPHACVESEHMASLSRRAELHRWPAMRILGHAVAAHIGRPLREVEVQEIYSCFPVAVRVQQRELELDPTSPATVTGGMTFAGGPLNNFTYQATVEVARRLRAAPESLGMVTAVSGLLTKPGITVWGGCPAPEVLVADFGQEAAAATATLEVTHGGAGPATVATATATYEGDAPIRAFVIADLPDGRRWVGTCHDPAFVQAATRREVIGTTVEVRGAECAPA